MAKILLVEDDNNLREIYEARLQAEGYDIVSAQDGEEALVVAKGEMPDLVISDVMMPKISGFEMLDILRNTEGLKDVKVIMLTALGQAEDQSRADSLGADRYLVKSQVTLEDIVNASKQLLGEIEAPAPATATPVAVASASAEPATAPAAAPAPMPDIQLSTPPPAPEPVAPIEPATPAPVIPLASAPPEDTEPDVSPQMPPTPASTVPDVATAATPAPAPAPAPVSIPVTESTSDEPQTIAQEASTVEAQIASFVSSQPTEAPAAVEPTPEAPAPTTTPEQEQALSDALTTLNGSTDTPAAGPTQPAPAAEPAAQAPATPPAEDEDLTSTHKKVIQPISEQEGPAKKSIEQLLSEEAAKESAASAQPTPAPAPTPTPTTQAPATTPVAAPAPTAPNGDFDPHSIAL